MSQKDSHVQGLCMPLMLREMPEDVGQSTFSIHEVCKVLIPGVEGRQQWQVVVEVVIGDSRVLGVPDQH